MGDRVQIGLLTGDAVPRYARSFEEAREQRQYIINVQIGLRLVNSQSVDTMAVTKSREKPQQNLTMTMTKKLTSQGILPTITYNTVCSCPTSNKDAKLLWRAEIF